MNMNEIEKKCCYCEHASPISETDSYICRKKGVVSYDFTCRKFSLDPMKLSPVLPANKLRFSVDDFMI